MTAWYEFGNGGKKGRPKDYVKGEILKDGRVVSTIFGNMMSYLEFND